MILCDCCVESVISRLVDTSTRHIVISSHRVGREHWHYCAVCEAIAPPRAWHCSTCNLCILKREHHCMFAGYCVGHFNHRFFILFLSWTWLGVVYCTYLNTVYVYSEVGLASPYALLKFIFPLLIIMSGMDISWDQVGTTSSHSQSQLTLVFQVAIFFWSVHVAALLLTSVLLVYHVR